MARPVAVIIGMEVIKLGDIDDDSPYRMMVDSWEEVPGGEMKVVRHSLVGTREPQKKERTLEDVLMSDPERREHVARELMRLDEEAVKKIEPIVRELYREQIRALHGQETLDWLDEEERKSQR